MRPQRAEGIEDLLMRMAKGGQLRGRVTEEQLIGVLDQVSLLALRPGLPLTVYRRRSRRTNEEVLPVRRRTRAVARSSSVSSHIHTE